MTADRTVLWEVADLYPCAQMSGTDAISCHLSDAHCGSHLELLHIAPEALTTAGVAFDQNGNSLDHLRAAYECSRFAVTKRFLRIDQKTDSGVVGAAWRLLSAEEVSALPPRNTRLLHRWAENKRKLDIWEARRRSTLHHGVITLSNKTKQQIAIGSGGGATTGNVTATRTTDERSAATSEEAKNAVEEREIEEIDDFNSTVSTDHPDYGDAAVRALHSLPPVWKIVHGPSAELWKLIDQREQLYDTVDDPVVEDHDSFVTVEVASRFFPSWKLGSFVTLYNVVNQYFSEDDQE